MQATALKPADLVQVAMQQAQLPVQPVPAPAGLKQSGELVKPRDNDPVWKYMCWNGIYFCNNSQTLTWADVMHIVHTYAAGVTACYAQQPHQFHPPEEAARYKAFLTWKMTMTLTQIPTPVDAVTEQRNMAWARQAIEYTRQEAGTVEMLPRHVIDRVTSTIRIVLPGTARRDIDSDSICTGLTGDAEPKEYKETDDFKYQQRG